MAVGAEIPDVNLNKMLEDEGLPRLTERRRSSRQRRNPSPACRLTFLVICVAIVELGDGLLLHLMRPYLSHNALIALDLVFMVGILVPAYYFFVFRPMQLYEKERKAAEDEIRFLSRQLILAGDRERRTVARDLYDQLGQSLSVLQFSMESLKGSFDDQHLTQIRQCDQMSESIARLGKMVRKASSRLIPPQLDDLGLIPTLEGAIEEIEQKDNNLRIDFSSRLLNGRLPGDIEHTLYAAFREAMENISRHARAAKVQVTLVGTQALVCLEIEDDGVGFDAEVIETRQGRKGIGLLGLRERVEASGGELCVDTAPGAGTHIRICLPRALRRRDDLGAR